MRRAVAIDEVEPLQDTRVHRNEAYMSIVLLSRVITCLGTISQVSPAIIEQLFTADFVYLQDLYVHVNDTGTSLIETRCPTCGTHFALDLSGNGCG
jgi:hypothetical protein